ncbi:MAG: NUDIX hydrolase [Acidobacteriota bacterium]
MDPDLFYRRKRVPRVTVDAWIRDDTGRLLLIRRGRRPFIGRWGLPGGFLEWKERAEECCAREALEETGLVVEVGRLLGVYSDPDRDPRGHNVTVLYDAIPVGGRAKGGDDAAEARWFSEKQLEGVEFAFDHRDIVTEQLARRPRRRAPRAAGPSRRARTAASRG